MLCTYKNIDTNTPYACIYMIQDRSIEYLHPVVCAVCVSYACVLQERVVLGGERWWTADTLTEKMGEEEIQHMADQPGWLVEWTLWFETWEKIDNREKEMNQITTVVLDKFFVSRQSRSVKYQPPDDRCRVLFEYTGRRRAVSVFCIHTHNPTYKY